MRNHLAEEVLDKNRSIRQMHSSTDVSAIIQGFEQTSVIVKFFNDDVPTCITNLQDERLNKFQSCINVPTSQT